MKRERGTTTVEAALTLLALLVLIFGILEASRFMNIYGTLNDAAREGARLAVAPFPGTSTLPSNAAIEAEVTRFLDAANIQGANITIAQVTTARGDQSTSVRVAVDYQVISIAMFTSLEFNISGFAVMRNETSP